MFEGTLPCLDGVGGKQRIPMKPVNWKTGMIDGWEQLGDANSFHAGLRAKLQAGQLHRHPTFHAAAKRECGEVGNVHAILVQAVAAGAAQPAGVKNVVAQNNFGAGEISGSLQLPLTERALSADVDFSRWR